MKFNNPNAHATLQWLSEQDSVDSPQFVEHEVAGFEAIQFVYANTFFSIDNEKDVIIKSVNSNPSIKYTDLLTGTAHLGAAAQQLWSKP